MTLDGALPVLADELRSRFQRVPTTSRSPISSASSASRGLPEPSRSLIICFARWDEWPPSVRSRFATSSPSKAVRIASGYHLRQLDEEAGCTRSTEGLRSHRTPASEQVRESAKSATPGIDRVDTPGYTPQQGRSRRGVAFCNPA